MHAAALNVRKTARENVFDLYVDSRGAGYFEFSLDEGEGRGKISGNPRENVHKYGV